MSDTNNYSGGIGFAGALTIVFIVLKLVGTINWSWWWVLSPMWILIILAILKVFELWGSVMVIAICDHFKNKRSLF